jgi:hypothetical protein
VRQGARPPRRARRPARGRAALRASEANGLSRGMHPPGGFVLGGGRGADGHGARPLCCLPVAHARVAHSSSRPSRRSARALGPAARLPGCRRGRGDHGHAAPWRRLARRRRGCPARGPGGAVARPTAGLARRRGARGYPAPGSRPRRCGLGGARARPRRAAPDGLAGQGRGRCGPARCRASGGSYQCGYCVHAPAGGRFAGIARTSSGRRRSMLLIFRMAGVHVYVLVFSCVFLFMNKKI